jgi:hypothetical protein
MIVVTFEKNGIRGEEHIAPKSRGMELDTARGIVRRKHGKVDIVNIAIVPDEKLTTWVPPKPPEGYIPENMKQTKFAFGRVIKNPVSFVPKDDDFDDE